VDALEQLECDLRGGSMNCWWKTSKNEVFTGNLIISFLNSFVPIKRLLLVVLSLHFVTNLSVNTDRLTTDNCSNSDRGKRNGI
jgi:hypothetical protein